jgi:hypothetical protein
MPRMPLALIALVFLVVCSLVGGGFFDGHICDL